MKKSSIEKSVDTKDITAEQLKAISKYTRRDMKKEELFVFSIILCDNEIDRDLESFPKESLDKLADLYLGKTGIFDHLPTVENQSARIFFTQVVSDGSQTSLGEDYYALKAFAYMVRCDKTTDLILEIDAGIKKEVSVGCSVERIVCSVCGSNVKATGCKHEKGKRYSGVYCYHLLENPTDAYEWSFVAVPSQKNAGVIKKLGGEVVENVPFLDRIFTAKGTVSLTHGEAMQLKGYIANLKALSVSGEEYIRQIKRDIVRNASLTQPEMDSRVLEDVCDCMSLDQLKAFHKSYEALRERDFTPTLQLNPEEKCPEESQGHFKI